MSRKGPPNINRPAVVHVPPACPACSSTEYEVLRIANDADINGIRDGHVYNHIVWRRVRCKACGQHYTIVTYEFRPTIELQHDQAEALDDAEPFDEPHEDDEALADDNDEAEPTDTPARPARTKKPKAKK